MVEVEKIRAIMEKLELSIDSLFTSLPDVADITYICDKFMNELEIEGTVVEGLTGKYIVVGDLHGNFTDLVYIIKTYGLPNKDLKYLFLGDYVDRGYNSIETILYLMCLKILFPDFVTMIRGNHEFIRVCKVYGFYEECVSRMGEDSGEIFFDLITSTFPFLPLGAILPNRIFACHGGISSHINNIDDIKSIDRFDIINFDSNQIVSDLVWGDPRNLDDGELTAPSPRGVGEVFSAEKTQKFLQDSNLKSIIRGHESCSNGFLHSLSNSKGETICFTVFSASNYCDGNNEGAIAILAEDGKITFDQYSTSYSCDYSDFSSDGYDFTEPPIMNDFQQNYIECLN
ncbi:Ser/Thr protein phosphatase, putative [Trichomonas vaginalis G3]|uniref:Serine/threonine-protein phosphatase n=1 Tax=Trichomonas vaginalis (strain ATCC PRA-98 / G3) TaxID=412133 RepID=A2DIY7_TRIV3|nr:phosphoprotein phosphatase protein [Trichomonas vaginalis G3]EAY19562.1 Ser/Thr protein phosphatase, putative [Trichomonas vaginalis G3]KAI5515891.1 phosphoprotein phosphatase protein [Trichomonas vaginalis G3]|eukprot:XP_001580548.1 Ser/Thr protein phosphatase [Trichomonas vaginalis G3]